MADAMRKHAGLELAQIEIAFCPNNDGGAMLTESLKDL